MIQKIVAVWLWFELNIGLSPNKDEIRKLLAISAYRKRDFERAFRFVVYRILAQEKVKNYYVDSVPDICFNIGEQLIEVKDFDIKDLNETTEIQKSKERFVVLAR